MARGDSKAPFGTDDAGVSMETAGLQQALVVYRSDLVRFLSKRLRCAFTARDLVQEVYFRVRRIESGARVDNPRALLFQIAANLATDHCRVESRREELLEWARELLWYAEEEPSPERSALARSEIEQLQAALIQLPERTQEIFYLNRFEGMTQREISARLGISQKSVEKHMGRALDHLSLARNERQG